MAKPKIGQEIFPPLRTKFIILLLQTGAASMLFYLLGGGAFIEKHLSDPILFFTAFTLIPALGALTGELARRRRMTRFFEERHSEEIFRKASIYWLLAPQSLGMCLGYALVLLLFSAT